MKQVIPAGTDGARVAMHIWSRVPPRAAIEQLQRLAAQPYVVERIAAMPDLHVANAIAVGTVFATEGTAVPAALGGDLGCGVSAVRFPFPGRSLGLRDLQAIVSQWAARIPVGDGVHRARDREVPLRLQPELLSTHALERERTRLAAKHLGTLGGGNHFVELDCATDGDAWLLVHTGSRGLGAAIGAHHGKAARGADGSDLGGLSASTESGQACLRDLAWAQQFAAANRAAIVAVASEVIERICGVAADAASALDVPHNFVREEEHQGRTLLVHRKGAIAAPAGERALIPGSMGTASYLVEGLGEPTSFRSASHGAGRVMTRREARDHIEPKRFAQAMKRVVYDERRARSLIEEAPMAYREIAEVLEDQRDLVRPLLRLEPLAVLKG